MMYVAAQFNGKSNRVYSRVCQLSIESAVCNTNRWQQAADGLILNAGNATRGAGHIITKNEQGSSNVQPTSPVSGSTEAQLRLPQPAEAASDSPNHAGGHGEPRSCTAPSVSGATTRQGLSQVTALLSPAAYTGVPVTKRGITLAFLRAFVAAAGSDVSVAATVEAVVRPASAAVRCCLFDMVPREVTGSPEYFISHTWSRKLGELLSLLDTRFEGEPRRGADVLLWLDIFAINQWPYVGEKGLLEDDVANLGAVVAAVRRTLFMLDAQGVVLTRIWCLFEIWQTVRMKGVDALEVLAYAMPDLEALFEGLDVSKAQATLEDDRVRILADIERDMGSTSALGLQIKQALVAAATAEAQLKLAAWEAWQAHAGKQAQQLPTDLDRKQLESENPGVGTMEVGVPNGVVTTQAPAGGVSPADIPVQDRLAHAAAAACNKAGTMAAAAGQQAAADTFYRQAHELLSTNFGPRHADTLSTLNNIGTTLLRLGRFREARGVLAQVVEARSEVLGPEAPATLEAIANLSGCLIDAGLYTEAEPLCKKVGKAREAAYGPIHPLTLQAVNNLAVCTVGQGRYDAAVPMLKFVYEVRTQTLGAAHPATLRVMRTLASCMQSLGKNSEAEDLYRSVVAARLQVLGPGHPDTWEAKAELGGCLSSLGRAAEAMALQREALDEATKQLGLEHPETLRYSESCAIEMAQAGAVVEAEALQRRVLDATIRLLGTEHPDVLRITTNLANSLMVQGKAQEAYELLAGAVCLSTKLLGPQHPGTLSCLNALALCLSDLQRLADAEPLYCQVLAARQQVLGHEHPDTLKSLSNLGRCYLQLGRDKEALVLLQQVAEARVRVLGPQHPATLDARFNVAVTLRDKGDDIAAAVQMLEDVLDVQGTSLGQEHPSTCLTAQHLALAKQRQAARA